MRCTFPSPGTFTKPDIRSRPFRCFLRERSVSLRSIPATATFSAGVALPSHSRGWESSPCPESGEGHYPPRSIDAFHLAFFHFIIIVYAAYMQKIQRALLSVFDKAGLIPFARMLAEAGVELISTGGTAKALREGRLTVKDLSDHTGFPE